MCIIWFTTRCIWKCTYDLHENEHIRFNSSPFFLCFSFLHFKTLPISLEVGIRFKALHSKDN